MISPIPNLRSFPRRAFSLVEVLLAIFILGIGLIMVASVFPVGANWTRQTTETSVGQTVAQDALTVIKTYYGPNGALNSFIRPDFVGGKNTILTRDLISPPFPVTPFRLTPFTLQPLPGFINIPPTERAYQFGSSNPFPASNVAACTYFWTALARLSPVHRNPLGVSAVAPNGFTLSSSYNYDIYILVFRKGSAQNTFSQTPSNVPPGYFELPGLRNFDPLNPGQILFPSTLLPSVGYAPWSPGQHDPGHTPTVFNSVPAMGQYGIGAQSGTVFRQVVDPTVALGAAGPTGAVPRPLISTIPTVEPVIYCPAADGADNSVTPLIYIYQTTLTF